MEFELEMTAADFVQQRVARPEAAIEQVRAGRRQKMPRQTVAVLAMIAAGGVEVVYAVK